MIEQIEHKKAHTRAEVLEMIGDIPDSDIKPPDNVLFVCRLNPYTTEENLRLIFSQFGTLKSCEIIKDRISLDSLCYGFIEFEDVKSCENAYFKMNNVNIDDRRIHVDFSQSVARVDWGKVGGWKKYFSNFASKMNKSDAKEFRKHVGFRDEDRADEGKYSLVYEDESRSNNRKRSRSKSPNDRQHKKRKSRSPRRNKRYDRKDEREDKKDRRNRR